jgi:hypothetical protein
MPQRRLRRPFSYRPSFEFLEDRSVPAVTAVQDGAGIVTVTLGSAGDMATITGTAADGKSIDVTDTLGTHTDSFSKVTGIVVVDGGANALQSVTFQDSGSGTAIDITGAISVTGIETVDFATDLDPVQAATVTVTGATTIRFDGDVTTTAAGGQSYDGAAVLGNATVTLNAGTSGAVNFGGTINSDVGAARALIVNAGGTTTFTGAVGGTLPLASLVTDAIGSVRLGNNVQTTGAQTYNDAVVITGINPVTLASTGGGDIRFLSTVDGTSSGTNSIAVNTSGITSFGAAVGTVALGGVTTDATGTTEIKGNVTTVGAQNYNDAVTLFGSAITLTSTAGGNLNFRSTLDGNVAGQTSLTLTTTSGATTFNGSVGATKPLGSITTDAGTGNTIFGASGSTITVTTQNNQTYNDPVSVNGTAVTFASAGNGNITFASTLGGTANASTAVTVNTGGTTTFTGAVNGTNNAIASLTTDNAGQAGESTVIRSNVAVSSTVDFGDAVTFNPSSGVTSQTVSTVIGAITFEKTLGGASAVPVTVKAGSDVTFDGNAAFTASGSRLNVQAGATGGGKTAFATGVSIGADIQTWQAGDGTGGLGSATIDLVTHAPSFRNAAGTAAPGIFVLRQDGDVTDGTIPALSQFGTSTPANYTIISDDATLTLNTTTALSGANTANLTLASAQAMSIGTTINAPNGTVRLRSVNANISQTGGGITAAGLGVRSGTFATLVGNNAIGGSFAALATTGNIQFANGTAYTVGAIGADPLSLIFNSVSGVATGSGSVAFTQPGTAPLNVTFATAVSGSTITATGGSGDDRVTINYTLGASVTGSFTFTGNGGNDSLILTDAGGVSAHTYVIGATATRDSGSALNYSGVETVSVTGGTAADTFTVTPDATAAITVVGGNPTGTSGDKLTVSIAGAGSPNLTATKQSDGLQGTATFSDKATVTFSQMETLSPQADIQVTSSVTPPLVAIGGTATFTVLVKNAGPDAATGVTIDDVFPAGAGFSWTATASSGSSVTTASGTGNIHTTANLIANGTVTFTITATANPGFLGTISNTLSASAATTAFDTDTSNNQATSSFSTQPVALTAIGAGAGGGPAVRVLNADGSTRFNFFAYDPSYTGGVTVATGDINGDGVEDIVTGSATTASHVKVFDGVTGSPIASFFAFPGFSGGVNVAIAHGDVIVGAGFGGGPVFAGYHISGGTVTQTFSRLAYDASFRGGVRVAGSANFIATAPGPTGSSQIEVFNASTLALVSSFYAFPTSISTGFNIAMSKSGVAETVIVGTDSGGTPLVVTADAQTGAVSSSALAFDASFTGGVRVASTLTPDGQQGTVLAAGPGGGPRIRILRPNGSTAVDLFAFDPSFTGGVYVG